MKTVMHRPEEHVHSSWKNLPTCVISLEPHNKSRETGSIPFLEK